MKCLKLQTCDGNGCETDAKWMREGCEIVDGINVITMPKECRMHGIGAHIVICKMRGNVVGEYVANKCRKFAG